MKRWIHASRDIEYKIKDYIAAWAKDDVKEGKPMANFRQFKEEMKAEGLKADEDGYDYYVACYNNACSNSNKTVKCSNDATAQDSTSEIKDELIEVFNNVVGDTWPIAESYQGNLIVTSKDAFNETEASRMVIKLNNELKRLGLSKHVVKVKYYYSGGKDDSRPLRVYMTLKKYLTI